MTIDELGDLSPLDRHDPWCRPDDAIAELCRVVVAETRFDEVLDVVTTLALIAVPADGCAVSVVRRPVQVAPAVVDVNASTALSGSLARAETDLGHGPATDALVAGQPVRSGDLPHEVRWPRWTRRAAAVGMRSALATPLPGAPTAIGTLLWMSAGHDRFDAIHEDAAHRFAAAAGPAVRSAQVADQLRTEQDNLRTALTSRATIDQAIGILVARSGGTPEEAWERLRVLSHREHVKVAELARRTVEQAVRRNRRHTG